MATVTRRRAKRHPIPLGFKALCAGIGVLWVAWVVWNWSISPALGMFQLVGGVLLFVLEYPAGMALLGLVVLVAGGVFGGVWGFAGVALAILGLCGALDGGLGPYADRDC